MTSVDIVGISRSLLSLQIHVIRELDRKPFIAGRFVIPPREQVLTASAAELGFAENEARSAVWLVVVDLGYPGFAVTLIVTSDGTAKLLRDDEVLASADHTKPDIHRLSEGLIVAAEEAVVSCSPTDIHMLPDAGEVSFRLRVGDDTLGASATLEQLAGTAHPLSALFRHARGLIAALAAEASE